MDFPNKLVASATYMTFWIPQSQINPAVWISAYMIAPIIFNMFNVRRYGEIEFWLTLQKVVTFVVLNAFGLHMAMGASTVEPLWGTDENYNLIPCNNSTAFPCVGPLGFNCIFCFSNKLMKTGGKQQ